MAVSVKPSGKAPEIAALPGAGGRFLAFVIEQHPFAYAAARKAWTATSGKSLDALKATIAAELRHPAPDLPETTPFVSAPDRLDDEIARLLDAVDAFFARDVIASSITADEQRFLLRGIVLTRALDNKMKQLFLSSEMKYGELGFQGEGFP